MTAVRMPRLAISGRKTNEVVNPIIVVWVAMKNFHLHARRKSGQFLAIYPWDIIGMNGDEVEVIFHA
jgi:hypothetical protein